MEAKGRYSIVTCCARRALESNAEVIGILYQNPEEVESAGGTLQLQFTLTEYGGRAAPAELGFCTLR